MLNALIRFSLKHRPIILAAAILLLVLGLQTLRELPVEVLPDMTKRGAVRSVYDGRYVFSRYFSPRQHNRPTTLEDLYRVNDVELFDLQTDPSEVVNLAARQGAHRELVMAMNEKLNQLIDTEVGEDRGQMLPGGVEAGWEVTAETMAP